MDGGRDDGKCVKINYLANLSQFLLCVIVIGERPFYLSTTYRPPTRLLHGRYDKAQLLRYSEELQVVYCDPVIGHNKLRRYDHVDVERRTWQSRVGTASLMGYVIQREIGGQARIC